MNELPGKAPLRLAALFIALLTLTAAGSAEAAPVASATVAAEGKGVRVAVTITGTPLPKAVTVRTGNYSASLSGSRASWRSGILTGKKGAAFRARAGKSIGVSMTVGRKVVRSSAKVAAGGSGGGAAGGGGTAGGAGSGGAADGPPFSPPGKRLVGTEAVNAIQKYLLDATFTDCVAGFPNCPYVNFYGFLANGTMNYCRLTPSPGSDIKNAPAPFQITGAEQNPDGEWGVSMSVQSYGNTTNYWWDVRPNGSVIGRYWGPGSNPATDPATDQITGLTWVRGGQRCVY